MAICVDANAPDIPVGAISSCRIAGVFSLNPAIGKTDISTIAEITAPGFEAALHRKRDFDRIRIRCQLDITTSFDRL